MSSSGYYLLDEAMWICVCMLRVFITRAEPNFTSSFDKFRSTQKTSAFKIFPIQFLFGNILYNKEN